MYSIIHNVKRHLKQVNTVLSLPVLSQIFEKGVYYYDVQERFHRRNH